MRGLILLLLMWACTYLMITALRFQDTMRTLDNQVNTYQQEYQVTHEKLVQCMKLLNN